jgi:2,3-bisphosphoglycerate-independent phosphoglycerate mutase
MNTQKQTKVLIILDGWGHSEVVENNAVALARTPVWDNLTLNLHIP